MDIYRQENEEIEVVYDGPKHKSNLLVRTMGLGLVIGSCIVCSAPCWFCIIPPSYMSSNSGPEPLTQNGPQLSSEVSPW